MRLSIILDSSIFLLIQTNFTLTFIEKSIIKMTSLILEIQSDRLKLVAATAKTLEADINDHSHLAKLLQAEIPENWPPDLTEDALLPTAQKLDADPSRVGWYFWYIILPSKPPETPTVVGICGFKGRPKRDGIIEIGYSMLHQYRRQGYASEAVGSLVLWAFGQSGVRRVIAQTFPDLTASIRVMEKNGFLLDGPGSEEGVVRYGISCPPAD